MTASPAQRVVAYDPQENRLVYYSREADAEFWDERWADNLTEKDIKRFNWDVVRWTRRFLPAGSKVLDGGCGISHTVWSLREAKYDAWGADFAKDTVNAVKRVIPDLQVLEGDVRALPFEENSFDGVWSLGVIEHFPEGYEPIVAEMARILRPGGYAFVTFPAMSPLRRMKAAVGAYPRFAGGYSGFYQFALDPKSVVETFERHGFQVAANSPRGGLMGLKDESGFLRPMLQRVFDSRSKLVRVARGGLNRVLAPLSFHTRIVVFRMPVN